MHEVKPLYSNGQSHPSANGIATRPVNWGNSRHTYGNSSQSIRVMLILSTSLDCESLSALLSQRRGIDLVESSADLDFGMARCRRLSPKLLIIDPKIDDQAIDQAVGMMLEGFVEHVIVLDDRVHEGLVARLLAMPSVSYMTRHAGLDALHAAAIKVATRSVRVFDPAIDHRIRRTPRGLRLEQHLDQPSVAALTVREREVMQLLARGNSVRDCAQQMRLAESTIDNHKSRLMKKLQIHKAAELTHVAIRDGLISV
ncbi:MAG: response regulator transcription factor [Planctomycetes bacterium]|nr:response regulator transcription factor [Planctomycetota bacterium]